MATTVESRITGVPLGDTGSDSACCNASSSSSGWNGLGTNLEWWSSRMASCVDAPACAEQRITGTAPSSSDARMVSRTLSPSMPGEADVEQHRVGPLVHSSSSASSPVTASHTS